MMLMLNEYKRIDKHTQDPNDISGDYKHVKANMNKLVELKVEKEDVLDFEFGRDWY